MDPYVVLGVASNAPQKEIRRAYRKLALEKHPDRNPHDRSRAESDLKQLNEAYHILRDPERKAAYDRRKGASFVEPQRNQTRHRPRRGGDLNVRTAITVAEARAGFIREIVINAPTRCDRCSGTGADPVRRATLRPQLCEACRGRGCRRCFHRGYILPACSSCRGAGAIEAARRILVTVPPGIRSGERIRVPGNGMPSVFPDAPAGDLLVEVCVG